MALWYFITEMEYKVLEESSCIGLHKSSEAAVTRLLIVEVQCYLSWNEFTQYMSICINLTTLRKCSLRFIVCLHGFLPLLKGETEE